MNDNDAEQTCSACSSDNVRFAVVAYGLVIALLVAGAVAVHAWVSDGMVGS